MKKNIHPTTGGFLLAEIFLVCALFIALTASLSLMGTITQRFLIGSSLRMQAFEIGRSKLLETLSLIEKDFSYATSSVTKQQDFTIHTDTSMTDNFTKNTKVTVFYKLFGREPLFTLEAKSTNTKESEGQSSCRPANVLGWKNPKISFFDLNSLGIPIQPTDIDIVGSYAYVGSNSANASSSDFFIYNISNPLKVNLVSHIDTGPGINAVHVAGDRAYLANSSINSQLQIIDIYDRKKPKLITSYKLPGIYGTSTPIGTAIFYKNKKVFLGIDKSNIGELHYIDVSSQPISLNEQEIGHGINDIFAFENKLYIASPHRDELKIFSIDKTNSLNLISSYDDPGSTGNGKRLSLFLDTIYVGKTKTFERDELIILASSTSPRKLSGIPFGVSVQGVIAYGKLLFTILNRQNDSFIIFDTSSTTPVGINTTPINFPAPPLNFDCDKEIFIIILNGSSLLYFITPYESI